ncbi:MAG: hypothetical protein AABW47_01935 [Nanoarchaeota archaeon]
MGVIRGFFAVIASILLFLSIFSSVFLLILSSSLNYDNLQKESKEVIKGILEKNMNISSAVDTALPFIQIYCQTNSEYVFNAQGYTFTIPCNITSGGREGIIDNGVDYLIKGIYYKEYDCEFIDCFSKNEIPTFIFSMKSYVFLNNLFYIFLFASFLLLVLTFFLIKKKTNVPILVGSLLIASSFPLFKISNLINFIPNETAVKIIGLFFSSAPSISIKVLIAGIILLVAGIILRIFKAGVSISNIFSKFKKPETKETKKIANSKSK